MTEAIIVACITGGLTLIGTILTTRQSNSKTLYRLDQLEAKMEKHNHMIERLYIAEGQIRLLDEKQKDLEGDIDTLKKAAIS